VGLDLSVCVGHSTTPETGSTVKPETIKIHYFARCRLLAGCSEETFEMKSPCSVDEVRDLIISRHPNLRAMLNITRIALNCEFTDGSEMIKAGDEIALIPPVSGGAPTPRVKITDSALSLHEAADMLGPIAPAEGALGTFVGVVRKNSLGKEVEYLVYEAYDDMALKKMTQIIEEAHSKWEITRAAIVHRKGRLEIGDVAVSIAVAAPHRAPALEACRYIIERLKEDVPIWKMEQGVDGTSWWGKGP